MNFLDNGKKKKDTISKAILIESYDYDSDLPLLKKRRYTLASPRKEVSH